MALRVFKDGLQSYSENRKLKGSGYTTLKEYELATSLGFNNKKAQLYLNQSGYERVDDMISYWDRVYFNVNSLLKSKAYVNFQMIKETTTLTQLENLETHFQSYLKKINHHIAELSNILAMQIGIFKLFSSRSGEMFINLDYDYLELKNAAFNDLYNHAIQVKEELMSEIEERKDWFLMWEEYIDPIRISNISEPISLQKISQIINSSLDQGEQRLLFLLDPQNRFEFEITKHRYVDKELGFQALMVL